MRRVHDFLEQAARDLEASHALIKSGFYEWSCFLAHQSSEKAVKALLENNGLIVRGHSVLRYLRIYSDISPVEDRYKEFAAVLDTYFISARHVTAYDIGTPAEYFTEERAKEAVDHAENILGWVRGKIEG